MRVIIMGCGRVGVDLAQRLYRDGHEVTVVDQNATALERLPADFGGRTVEGEALSRDVLHRAGIETADALVAATNSDTLNAVVAHVARAVYGLQRVVVRCYDPARRALHESFGLPLVSSTNWASHRIEALIQAEPTQAVYAAGNGAVEIWDLPVPAVVAGQTVAAVMADAEAIPAALTRAGRATLPTGDSVLREDDVLTVSASFAGLQAVRRQLGLPAAEGA